jgi:hypothetical protein
MIFIRLSFAAIIASACIGPSAARADTAMGQLVYNFTYSANQNITARDSSDSAEPIGNEGGGVGAGGSGMSHYNGNLTDKGTMTVDILKKQSDGALVVSISEQGENIRRAPAATCVVYGNTNVICDPNKTVYTEEYTLLRFLGSNFIDPNQLDAKKHWSVTQNSADENITADYAIDSNSNGTMEIGEKRTVKETGAGHLTSNVETKIGYDFTRTVPISVNEYVTQRTDSGIRGTSTTIYQTTLNLVSDSMAKT